MVTNCPSPDEFDDLNHASFPPSNLGLTFNVCLQHEGGGLKMSPSLLLLGGYAES
jgi:hypothetical protein